MKGGVVDETKLVLWNKDWTYTIDIDLCHLDQLNSRKSAVHPGHILAIPGHEGVLISSRRLNADRARNWPAFERICQSKSIKPNPRATGAEHMTNTPLHHVTFAVICFSGCGFNIEVSLLCGIHDASNLFKNLFCQCS